MAASEWRRADSPMTVNDGRALNSLAGPVLTSDLTGVQETVHAIPWSAGQRAFGTGLHCTGLAVLKVMNVCIVYVRLKPREKGEYRSRSMPARHD